MEVEEDETMPRRASLPPFDEICTESPGNRVMSVTRCGDAGEPEDRAQWLLKIDAYLLVE